MRKLIAFAILFGLTACSKAQDKKPDEKPAEEPTPKKLGIGDAAPPLAVTKWLQGAEIKSFEPGKTYVVDFWATWCGPCIMSMPHMDELAAEFKGQGLTVVAVTSKDPNNSQEQVEQFVKDRGSKYAFGFAYCDDRATDKAYMKAAGQDGIPCLFVIGKDGKVAFIGHPMELDDVLPKVVAGTWRGLADVDEIQAMNAEFNKVYEKAEKDPPAALEALDAFGKKYPHKTKSDQYAVTRMAFLLGSKKYDDAKAAAQPLMKKFAEKQNAGGLNSVRGIWTSKQLNPDQKNLDVAVTAAEALLKTGKSDSMTLARVAETYAAAGDKDKAAELLDKAIAAANGNEKLKEFLESQLKKVKGDEKK